MKKATSKQLRFPTAPFPNTEHLWPQPIMQERLNEEVRRHEGGYPHLPE